MEGLLSMGLHRLLFTIFLIKSSLIPKILLTSACIGPYLVIKKSKLMKIEFYRHWNRIGVPEIESAPGAYFEKVRHWKI